MKQSTFDQLESFAKTEKSVRDKPSIEHRTLSTEERKELFKSIRSSGTSSETVSRKENAENSNECSKEGLGNITVPSSSPVDSPPTEKVDLGEILPDDADFEALNSPREDYTALEFADPVELLSFFSAPIRDGHVIPHNWQIEVSEFLARGHTTGSRKVTAQDPIKFYLRAANGSGKDAYVIAPFAVWFCCSKIRSRCILTSSSYSQLVSQTENYIRSVCIAINNYFDEKVFIIKRQHIICTLTGSEIKMFVTDDPGKAEGYHPFPDYPDAEMAIVVNEAKSVKDEIFHALRRCTGYNYWIEVSSPGKSSGHFYTMVINALDWEEGYQQGKSFTRRVTAYDCAHIPVSEIEDAKLEFPEGEQSWLFRSIYLAEFTSIDEAVVILPEIIQAILRKSALKQIPHTRLTGIGLRVGIDCAAGGDENTIYLIDGNKIIDKDTFIEKDTTKTSKRFYWKLKQWETLGLKQDHTFGDDGGVGRAILDQLRELGWTVNRVLNQSPALDKLRYGNRGAELYFHAGRIIQEGFFILPQDDKKLTDQLGNRYFRQAATGGKIILEAKREARAKGHGSPDRADALILALTGLTIEDFRKATVNTSAPAERKPRIRGRLFQGNIELLQHAEDQAYSEAEGQTKQTKRCFGYVSALSAHQQHEEMLNYGRN